MDTIFQIAAATVVIGWALYKLCRRIRRDIIRDDLTSMDASDILAVEAKWDTKPLTEEEAEFMTATRWDLN